MLTIAVCGNHQVVYCTESELSVTLESLGHKVIRLQENKHTTEEMLDLCVKNNVALFLYIHTHSWNTPGKMSMLQLIAALRKWEIKTASFHLDLYWGLNKGDKRQDRIGEHAFWHTDTVFTADGGHQTAFEERGVNHHWLPPAICARHCFRGEHKDEFAVDIAFVGARGYHEEYPFRARLLTWLEKTYGRRFRRFAGDMPGGTIREECLNDLYASVKVVVGDSCFGGSPFYWSDRVPETLGRGGFLIHPHTEGLDIPGLMTYAPGNLDQLKFLIDKMVKEPEQRQFMTDTAMVDVKKNHTYDQRMQTLLQAMEVV